MHARVVIPNSQREWRAMALVLAGATAGANGPAQTLIAEKGGREVGFP